MISNGACCQAKSSIYDCVGRTQTQCNKRTGRTSSTLSFQKWAAAERMVKGDPGISSLKMSRELVVTQKTAWNLRKKIRGVEQICPPVQAMFGGPLILD